jgi:RecA-family ATPase
VAHLFAGNENDRGEVTRFINALNRLAGETGAAVLLLGHPNKAGDSYSGSMPHRECYSFARRLERLCA